MISPAKAISSHNHYLKRKSDIIARVERLRRKRMLRLIEYKGGNCAKCGYDRCAGALDFHHRDPALKRFNLTVKNMTKAWHIILTEAEKCDLLCANCRREEHSSAWMIPEEHKEAWQSGRLRPGANGVDREVSEVRIL